MINMIRADLFKMCKSPVIKIIFAITTFCALVMTVMAYLIPQGKIAGAYTGIGFLLSDVNMISILGAVTASIYICGDFENKTIHAAIASGCSRAAIIVSKTAVFFSAVLFILLPYAITTCIALSSGSKFDMGSVSVGFLHIITKESGIALSGSVLLKMLADALTLMIVYMAQLSICVPLAFLLKKPVLVVAIYYGFTLLCAQLVGLSNNSPAFDKISSCTPYGGNYTFITLNTGTGDLVKAILVSIIFIIIMITVTHCMFRKSEIK